MSRTLLPAALALAFPLVLLLLHASAAASTPASSKSAASTKPAAPLLFTLGDQYLDVGMTRWFSKAGWQGGIAPYGEKFQPASGRFCDGKLTVDIITSYMHGKYLYPYLQTPPVTAQGSGFAMAGAGTKPWVNEGKTHSLQHQLDYLKEYVKGAPNKKALAQAVFLISVGTNDYLDVLLNGATETQAKKLVTGTTGAIEDAVKLIRTLTGSSRIVVYDVPPIGCLPQLRYAKNLSSTSPCFAAANRVADTHNAAISMKVDALRKQGFKDLILFKLSGGYTDILLKKGAGFADTTSVCCEGRTPKGRPIACGKKLAERGKLYSATACSDPAKHLWWDWLNPTEVANVHLAFTLWNSNSERFVRPYGMKRMLGGK
eukprot:TRINITY_DN35921_c0_g1_i1.p1 TRINITY_DN35921_c0_g1~~TRINITY_DN35921_c0_g1_i1.p1  ORF type:complete len:397 (-),score=1.51 TRINITY_DN35921_c0_g1_i1:394-1512(-)